MNHFKVCLLYTSAGVRDDTSFSCFGELVQLCLEALLDPPVCRNIEKFSPAVVALKDVGKQL